MEEFIHKLGTDAKLDAVRDWQRLVGVWIKDEHAEIDFRNLLESYTLELRHRAGRGSPYLAASQRLAVVRAMVADIDPLLNYLATMEDSDGNIPAFAKEICKLLFGVAHDLLVVINLIERGHGQPEVNHAT